MLKNVLCMMMAGGLLLAGCDGGKQTVRSQVAAQQQAPASIEEMFKGKTAGGKPVRAYKVILQAPAGEHLLLVLGDHQVPVSMETAAAVKIGGKEQTSPYLSIGNGMVLVAKVDGTALEPMSDGMNAVAAAPVADAGKPTFPMDKFNQKVSGGILQWPELDKL